jgi:nucleoside-diphosphate-sugar epimerase
VNVHVDDVAYVHIAALDPKIEGNQNFGVNWNGINGIDWDDKLDIVKKNFPKEVESGLFPLGGSQASNLIKFDATRNEDVFGFRFKSFEEQIVSLAGWYAEVSCESTKE